MVDDDYIPVESVLLIEEQGPDEPPWVVEIRRSMNALHHRVDAIYRKVVKMDLTPLENAVATLTASEAALEESDQKLIAAVVGAGQELVVLKSELEVLEQKTGQGEVPTTEQVQKILDGVSSVASHVTTAAGTINTQVDELTADTAAAQASGSVDSGAVASAGGQAVEGMPLYTFDTGDPSGIDAATWIKTNLLAADAGDAGLYTNVHDTVGAPATGVVPGVWTQYTGATTQLAPSPGL